MMVDWADKFGIFKILDENVFWGATYPVSYTYDGYDNRTTLTTYRDETNAGDTMTWHYDADGNQTTIKTKTGIWQVTYNGENRPIRWEQIADAEGNRIVFNATIITMTYDRMGRRVTKTTTQPDTNTTRAETFVYDGYLQVANQSTISNQTIQQFYIWDPTEPIATRPLVWNCDSKETAFYLHDGNKNVSEVVSASGEILAHYTYAPFGDCTASGFSALSNPWRFSSEYADDEIGCVYYNYRHYEPTMGRWLSQDVVNGVNLYLFISNQNYGFDCFGFMNVYGGWDVPEFILYYYRRFLFGDFISWLMGDNLDMSNWDRLDEFREDVKDSILETLSKSFRNKIECPSEGLYVTHLVSSEDDENKVYVWQIKNTASSWRDAFKDAFLVLNRGTFTASYDCFGMVKCACCDERCIERYSKKGDLTCHLVIKMKDDFANPMDFHSDTARRDHTDWVNLLVALKDGEFKKAMNYTTTELPFSSPYDITFPDWDLPSVNVNINYSCKQKR